MVDHFSPRDEKEMAELVTYAAGTKQPVEIYGFHSKRSIGRPLQVAARVSTSKLTGITLYEPSELVLSARAGTSLAEIEAVLEANGQELPFEPIDLARPLGDKAMGVSIASIFAANLSGPRRISRGAARDNLVGIRAVNGRGEIFKSGGRVMKNVTGVDLVKGLSGSWGTLAVMTEVTMKVLPRAETTRTLFFLNLPDEAAVGLMCAAMGTPYDVSGAIHLQPPFVQRFADRDIASLGSAVTALRIEGFAASAAYRGERLRKQLSAFGEAHFFDHEQSLAFWLEIRGLGFLAKANGPLWRITTAPDQGAKLVKAVNALLPCRAAYDWSGGLIWLELPPSNDASAMDLRRVISQFDADATLIRAEPGVRASVEVFQPLPEVNMTLTRRLKETFDPHRILNPGRMYASI